MGMAASQARLLTITARMHDIEYQAQSIQNAKIELATQSDEVYQDYLKALDATTLTINDGTGKLQAVNFNTLCGIDGMTFGNTRYALKDVHGRLIVSPEIAKAYSQFMNAMGDTHAAGGDAYAFAMFMLGKDYDTDEYTKADAEKYDKAFSEVEKKYVTENDDPNVNADLKELKKAIDELVERGKTDKSNGLTDKEKEELDNMIMKYNFQMNKLYAGEIYENINEGNYKADDFDDADYADFEYYANIFKQIQANGGSCISVDSCINIKSFDGFDGDAANNSEWLKNMIQSGNITIDKATTNTKNGKVTFSSTGVPSDDRLDYTTTSTIDKSALAKAEAEYEHKTKAIDQKDKKYDLDLSKLDTQRQALKTEYESVKKVIDENIDRTFGIFS